MSNAYGHLPGFQHLANSLLDFHEINPTNSLKTRTLDRFTDVELDELDVALGRKHFKRLGDGRILVYVDRIIRDDYQDDADHLWSALSLATGRPKARPPRDVNGALISRVSGLGPSRARDYILDLLRDSHGWPVPIVQSDGPDVAYAAIEAFTVAATALDPGPSGSVRLKDLSHRLFHDSHRLDPGSPLYRRVTDYLALHGGTIVRKKLGWRRRLLEARGVFQNAFESTVLVAGHLRLAFENVIDDRVLSNTRRGLATCLTLDEVTHLDAAPEHPRLILTIENPTPFANLTEAVPPHVLIVYTAGPANQAVTELLRRPALQPVPVWHWGDVDVGGFRILRDLERKTRAQPFLMDAETVAQYGNRLTPLQSRKKSYIKRHLHDFGPSAEAALRACLDRDGWLEQESIPLEAIAVRMRELLTAPTA